MESVPTNGRTLLRDRSPVGGVRRNVAREAVERRNGSLNRSRAMETTTMEIRRDGVAVIEGDNPFQEAGMSGEQVSNFGDTGAGAEYDARVRRMNPGYELAFDLVTAILRATCADDAHILLVGGGGSTEVRA